MFPCMCDSLPKFNDYYGTYVHMSWHTLYLDYHVFSGRDVHIPDFRLVCCSILSDGHSCVGVFSVLMVVW